MELLSDYLEGKKKKKKKEGLYSCLYRDPFLLLLVDLNLLFIRIDIMVSSIATRRKTKRVSIFIDGNNMFYAQQQNRWFFDPKKLLKHFIGEDENVELINAFWFTGIRNDTDQLAFRDALNSMGFTVRTKILKDTYEAGKQSQKANLDVELVIDMFNTAGQYDHIILFSGDGDFVVALDSLRSKNKIKVTVVSTDGMIARELKDSADCYVDLNSIRYDVEKAS